MKRIFQILVVCAMLQAVAAATVFANDEGKQKKQGAYIVIEGYVKHVAARTLTLDEKQYPVSIFVRVFLGSEKGTEIPMQQLANIGKVDKARIYLLGGKVEKIVVLNNI